MIARNKLVSYKYNHDISTDTEITNMRQVQPETLPKNSNFSSCLQNIKLKNDTT